MTYFEDSRGSLYPISRIHRIAEKPKSDKPTLYSHRIHLTDGDEFDALDVDASTVRFIQRCTAPVLPVEPGTYLLQFSPDRDGNFEESFVWRSRVIGWRVGGEHDGVEPIVLDTDFEEMTGLHAILHPCGKVETACGEHYDDQATWFEERVRWARIAAQRAESAA